MDNEENSSLEDNLPMVNYIMLHRIYDIMTLIANELAKDDESRLNISKMIEYHKEGFLLGPSPAYRSEENNG
jgi:hypothetical protein